MIRAFAKLKSSLPTNNMNLIITDNVADRKELIQLAKSEGVENNICWTGLISQKELTKRLHTADAYVSASRVETFGTAMVEAQACGLPVVATRTAGGDYIIDSPQKGILVVPDDVDSLASGMEELIKKVAAVLKQKIAEQFGMALI